MKTNRSSNSTGKTLCYKDQITTMNISLGKKVGQPRRNTK